MMKKIVLSLIFSCLYLCNVWAQVPEQMDADRVGRDSCSIYFKVGSSLIDSTLFSNQENLKLLSEKLKVLSDKENVDINIYPYASLEGSLARNKFLQEARGLSIKRYLESIHPSLRVNMYVLKDPYNWDVVIDYISKGTYSNKAVLLKVLKETPAYEFDPNTQQYLSIRKADFMNHLTQKQWQVLIDKCFPQMRKVDVLIDRKLPDTLVVKEVPVVKDTVDVAKEVVKQDTVLVSSQPEVVIQEEKKPFYMALKTNMLYDLALVPNIGVEFYLSRGWSVGGSWMYAWWNTDKHNIYWRTYGGELEFRKYFGRRASEKPLTGHHLGLYGQALTYDFETGGKGYQSKFSYGVGIEYGYSLPIGRRLNLDFGIGLGYLGGEYKSYEPIDNHYVWKETRQRHWFGPTKVEISLVWLIGRGNYNEKRR